MRRNQTKRNGIFTLLLLLTCHEAAFTQDSTSGTKPVFAQISFLYDFPQSFGLSSGINLPLKSVDKKCVSKGGKALEKQKEIIAGFNLGFYRYPYNYTGVLLSPFIGKRHYSSSTFFSETSVSIGVLRTFYDGKVYKVDPAGNVTGAGLFGRFYATSSISYALNWLLNKPAFALQLRPSLWFQYPYNSFIKPHASLEIGIKYEIARRKVVVNTINKTVRR
ncbi:MAG TPA: hypothetical protein VI385_14515 [Flavisolibacter sp.]